MNPITIHDPVSPGDNLGITVDSTASFPITVTVTWQLANGKDSTPVSVLFTEAATKTVLCPSGPPAAVGGTATNDGGYSDQGITVQ